MSKHAIILAGGVGTRLWPFSKRNSPKQFHSFLGDKKSLLQETYARAAKIVDKNNVWLVTTDAHAELSRTQLPKLNNDRIIIEPSGRNTAAAIYLAAQTILTNDPDATLAIFPSDHYIGIPEEFERVCQLALSICQQYPEQIVTLGIQPTEPNTGYGYIETGSEFLDKDDLRAFKVKTFREKPDLATAKKFLRSQRFLWNSGCFFANAQQISALFTEHANHIKNSVDSYLLSKSGQNYEKVPSEPFDSSVIEKTKDILVIPTSMGWSDLGSWEALYQILSEKNGEKNIVVGSHEGIDSGNSLIIGRNKLIATVGIQDAVIIETDEAILVCKRDSVQEVKKLVEKLDELGHHHYL